MLRKIVIFLLSLVITNVLYAHDFCNMQDSLGDKVVLKKPARRIISLAPNLTEIVYAVGAGKRLVGVSKYSDYPQAAKKIPVVATYNDINIERIISLKPDLVLAWQGGNPITQLNNLRKLGIPVYVSSFANVTDVAKNIAIIGRLTGTAVNAKNVAKTFMQTYTKLQRKYSHKQPITVFYELSLQPLMTLNARSLVGQVIKLCGGENIFAKMSILVPHVNLANVLQANPQVIFISGQMQDDADILRQWQEYRQLRAVKNKYIFTINPDLLERYGPRILQGAQQVCTYLDSVRQKQNLQPNLHYAWRMTKTHRFLA
jgi:iron complex transport system substrate-binding protein